MEMYHCYECNHDRPLSEMQKYDCVICCGRKCIILHSNDDIHTCNECGTTNLCIDCLSFGKCCFDFIDEKFVHGSASDRSFLEESDNYK